MSAQDWAVLLTAVTALVTAVGAVVVSIMITIPKLRETNNIARANAVKTGELAAKTDEVHKLVNSESAANARYRAVLERVITAAGLKVPPDVSIQLDTSTARVSGT